MVTVEKYDSMRSCVLQAIAQRRKVDVLDALALDVSPHALISLYQNIFVCELRREIKGFSEQTKHDVVKRVQRGESLYEISKEFPFGTYKFALLYVSATMGSNFQLSSILYNPEVIADERVRADLLRMVADDFVSSPDIDLVKEHVGKEYEDLLVQLLMKRKMCFETEVELRSKGKPKTPDILFVIPMAMRLSDAEQRRHGDSHGYAVINWIDSKAMFADRTQVKDNMQQFRAYNNRYGRGLVIYWHGFVEDVTEEVSDDMIFFRESFPEQWVFPTGELADGREPSFDSIALS